jgi:hypothetical protein
MANANVTRIGQINGSGDVDALFLMQFAGEVLTAFEETNVALEHTMTRTINSGKSAQFPATGKVGGEYHVPGTEITGLNLKAAETVITIDDLLISHGFIANIDEAKTHYDLRSIYSTEMGRFLAKTMDKHLLQVGVLAARATNVVDGEPGGSVILTGEAGLPSTPNFNTNGGVEVTMGASFSHSSVTVVCAGSGPAPDDPVIVTCGALYLASRGSYFRLIARMRCPASPPISAIVKMPFACTYCRGPIESKGSNPVCGEICTPARRKYLSTRLFGCE